MGHPIHKPKKHKVKPSEYFRLQIFLMLCFNVLPGSKQIIGINNTHERMFLSRTVNNKIYKFYSQNENY